MDVDVVVADIEREWVFERAERRDVVGESGGPGSDSAVGLRAGRDDIFWVCTVAGFRFFIILMVNEDTPLMVFVLVLLVELFVALAASTEKSGTLAYICTL